MAVLSFDDRSLGVAWQLGSCEPGTAPTLWESISAPMTVAAAWRELGRLDLDDQRARELLDGRDHWFRATIPSGVGAQVLEFDGLATIAEVWLNGTLLATSTSMFVPLSVDVDGAWRSDGSGADNVLELRFLSLTAWLDARKWPRARWRTKLVEEQRLRNVRTTLLGRMPSWSPPVPAVGPFRAMRLVAGEPVGDGESVGDAATPDHGPWEPWTAGPARGTTRTVTVDLGNDGNGFTLVVNGSPVFCRGAVWMPPDPVSMRADQDAVRRRLEIARAAGFNMLRISGTTAYEEPHFYKLCSELGIMVWQDLALANLDPPSDPASDGAFLAALEAEVRAQLGALRHQPCVVVVCGSSELEQQATMVGLGPEVLDSLVTRAQMAEWVADVLPDVVYVPSSPTGGHLPFAVNAGVGHYYGVGAYLRPLNDARHAGVRFAAESLAFANPPSPNAVSRFLHEGETAPTHPRWKARVPRDRGVGWDFEDVRDHYVRILFGHDQLSVRYGDPLRYLALGRAAVAEVMARTFSEWRRSGSRCDGALVWTFNDLWDGAGWGIVDADGRAKSPIGPLGSVLAPVALFHTDEGVNGVDLWIANDTAEAVEATLSVRQYRHGSTVVAEGAREVVVGPRSVLRVPVDTVVGRFTDPTYAYRFGPKAHDATTGTLTDRLGGVLARTLHVADGTGSDPTSLGLHADASWLDRTRLAIDVSADRVARFLTVDAGSPWLIANDHTHAEPGRPTRMVAHYDADDPLPRRGYVSALNGDTEVSFTVPPRPDAAS